MAKKYPKNAKPRQCLQCGQGFRPMTDKLWEWIFKIHLQNSKKHNPFPRS